GPVRVPDLAPPRTDARNRLGVLVRELVGRRERQVALGVPLHDAPEIVVADRGERAPDALPGLLLDAGDRLPTRAVDHLAHHGVREQPGRGGSGRLVRGWRIARLPVRLRERLPRDDGPGEPLPA